MEDLGKDVRAAALDGGGKDGGGPEEPLAVESGEEVARRGEEGGEAEGEEVGRVARVGEEVARDAELAPADGREDWFFVELRDEFGDCITRSVKQHDFPGREGGREVSIIR